MRLTCLLILCFTGFCYNALSQTEIVDPDNFNDDRLNQLLLEYTNRERRKKRRGALDLYPVLDLAAKDHVKYMAERKYVGHIQKIKQKRTVQLRVNYYGGNSQFVGENVQMIPLKYEIQKSKNRLTYNQLAKMLGDNWRKSKGHYLNMVDKNYTGVSHQFAIKGGDLYVCQVFSAKHFKEEYPYKKGSVMNIKEAKPCKDCTQTRTKLSNNQGHIGWYTISNDSLYYWNIKHYTKSVIWSLGRKKINLSHQKNNINLIFSANGQIAVDIIHHEQFDCEGNGAFHNALYNDGYYLGFLDKKKVKSENIHSSPDLVQVYIGQIPEFNDEYFQVDYNYNKRHKPCVNNSIIFLRPDFFTPKEYFKIPKPKVSTNNSIELVDSIEIKIPFERNETSEDSAIFNELIQTLAQLKSKGTAILDISYTGVASIEGSEEINRRLIEKRGAIIGEVIQDYYPEEKMKKHFFENFIDFREGLVLYGIKEYQESSRKELRSYANQNRDESDIKELLNTTRQSTVKIRFKSTLQIADEALVLSVHNLENLIETERYEESRLLFQLLANNAIDGNEILADSLFELDIPLKEECKDLCWDYFVFTLHSSNQITNFEILNDLFEIGAIPSSNTFLEYRLLFNLFNDNEAIKINDFARKINNIKSAREKGWLETLELISGIQNFRYSIDTKAPVIVDNVLQNKFGVHKTYFVCQYLIQWGYYVESMVLLSKFARQKGHFPKLYKQYIKIAYYLDHFSDKSKYKKVMGVIKNLNEVAPQELCNLFIWKQMGIRSLDYKEIAQLFCENCRT